MQMAYIIIILWWVSILSLYRIRMHSIHPITIPHTTIITMHAFMQYWIEIEILIANFAPQLHVNLNNNNGNNEPVVSNGHIIVAAANTIQ